MKARTIHGSFRLKNGCSLPILARGRLLFVSCAVLVFAYGGFFNSAKAAYSGCPGSPQGVTATIEEDRVTLTNDSSECRNIGVVVYRLYSDTVREGAFYYSNTTALQAGSTRSYTLDPPLCSYVIDAIVGKPIKTARSKADYGSRLLAERVVKTSYGFCSPAGSGAVSANSRTVPLPKRAPLPQPKIAKAPLPQPKVLGASITPTSVSPLSVATGGGMGFLSLLLASTLASGTALLVEKRFETKAKRVY